MIAVQILSILLQIALVAKGLRLCERNGDTFGSWISSASVDTKQLHSFVHGNANAALQFDMTWLPNNCTYHRFTSKSVDAVLAHMAAKKALPRVHLIFMGDSALRGIMCGIGRIISGSELNGPNSNVVCGTAQNRKIVSFPDLHVRYNMQYGQRLTITFIYIEFLHNQATASLLLQMMNEHPYALILNTGAWDFLPQRTVREALGVNSTDLCDMPADEAISEARVADTVKKTLAAAGSIAKSKNVRAIYRTSHHNARYGTQCADGKLLPILQGTGWEVWDNTRISKDVWRTQNFDGFHFDRSNAHTVPEHQALRAATKAKQQQSPGMMEIQLAQSLLFFLFRDAISELHHESFNSA